MHNEQLVELTFSWLFAHSLSFNFSRPLLQRDWTYLGCYKDTGANRDLPHLTNIGGGNSVSSCIDHCYAQGKLIDTNFCEFCVILDFCTSLLLRDMLM